MILLTDKEIGQLVDKWSFEDKCTDHLLVSWVAKAQLKKVVELIIADSEGFDGFNQSPVIVSHKLWQALLEEVK